MRLGHDIYFDPLAACSHELHDTFSKEQCLRKRSNGAEHAALYAKGHAASSGYGLIGEGDYSGHLASSLARPRAFPFAGH
jgi:hypothetical protein